ncbi:hypothetical protein Glove_13g282 [Diversispora epigaea]|uniref:Uncharacterized protein n=1 Tax=Diversispora epigaea TaxID=1348612 RepID=A0A397JU48_9GLOM|nr:hypothetical protein Glove_13g282 [Diversispora epigaea]
MNTLTENFCENVHKIQEDLLTISEEAQLIIDCTGVYLALENSVVRIERPANNDALLKYTMDAMTAPEEGYDLTEAVHDHDLEGLASIAANFGRGSSQLKEEMSKVAQN